jgi:hypothetical protein
MGLVLALTVRQLATAALVFSGVVVPVVAIGLKKMTRGWDYYGGGPFAILREEPSNKRAAPPTLDPAIQAAEVRQMLAAKAARQRERGEQVLDVEVESARLLAVAQESGPPAHDEELRAEVRGLVVARNERRRRAGMPPLDVEAETDRQIADLAG